MLLELLQAAGIFLAAALFSLLCLPLWIFAAPAFIAYYFSRPPADALDVVEAQPA